MIVELDPLNVNQLRNCAIAVYEKIFAISEVFSTKLKFASDCIKHWFRNEHKRTFLESDTFSKMIYERKSNKLVSNKICN